jgi:probable F420-dependent oxidoreductase
MKFGIALGGVRSRPWTAVTEEADRLGYESVWMPEHLVLPVDMGGSPFVGDAHPPVPANTPVFDPFTYLGFLAGRTGRIRFGTHVYNIGLRHPFVVARAVATLDVVSGGRAEFGVGASWLEAEWRAVGLDFASRGRRVDESLEVCRRLWSEDVVEHHGEFFDFDPVMFAPKPTQRPWPPIHIGGDGPAALRPAGADHHHLRERIARPRRAEATGRGRGGPGAGAPVVGRRRRRRLARTLRRPGHLPAGLRQAGSGLSRRGTVRGR